MPFYDDITKIAAGHDVALLDLDLITSLTTGSVLFLPVLSVGKYSRGEKKTKANGVKGRSGFKSKQWKSGFMTLAQYDYVIANLEGLVTAYSWLGTTTPARFNAVLDMGDVEDYEPTNTTDHGWGLIDVIWQFSMIEVL